MAVETVPLTQLIVALIKEKMVVLDVVVAGAGPVGLMLAAELGLAGVRPVVLERLPEPSALPKANGLVGQVVQLLDHRGLLERFGAGAPVVGPTASYQFAGLPLDLARLGASPLHLLTIPQPRLVSLLDERARELGADVRLGHELRALVQDEDGVTLDVRGPDGDRRLRARYLVGCDGAHSLVRKQAGVAFPGTSRGGVTRIGHVRLADSLVVSGTRELEVPGVGRVRPGFTRTPRGTFAVMSFEPGVYVLASIEADSGPDDPAAPMTLDELRDSVRRVLGADLPMGEPRWLTRNAGQARLADRYRAGRVLLAGDAAHLFPAGGAALNVGLMDAVNLAWKLAAECGGWAPPGLLDTYESERRAVGRRVLVHTRAQAALMAPGEDVDALRELVGELLGHEESLRHVAELLHGPDVPQGGGEPGAHPLAGRWAPDAPLETGGATRVVELMRRARPVLLDLAGREALRGEADGWRDRVDVVAAASRQPPADALLIRPDGFVAWAAGPGDRDAEAGPALRRALGRWFGAPAGV
jgi:2-polyprenyl-6-methoxyphenol hydroxylase-like FAD-dependent oxidoreductase